MINSLEAITQDIQSEFSATLGFEAGVREQTEQALDVMREVIADLPNTERVSFIPVGSRFKGYATEESDLDLAIVIYEWGETGYSAPRVFRETIHEVVVERVGIQVSHRDRHAGPGADSALTPDLVDYGHGVYPERSLAFLFAPDIFTGSRAADRRAELLESLPTRPETSLQYVRSEYERQLVMPKCMDTKVLNRYFCRLSMSGLYDATVAEVEPAFRAAYQARSRKFGIAALEGVSSGA